VTIKRTQIAALSLSAAALVGIALHEGYSDKAYVPVPGDKTTIGFGTTEGVKPGDTITPPQALVRALQDANRYEVFMKQCVTVPLHQHEYDAYVSLAYNIGPNAFCKSTLVKKLNTSDYAGACAEIKRWDKFNGRPLRGLTVRRETEYRKCMGEV
jgi:lysozyme